MWFALHMADTILVDRDGAVATITLNRPERLNAMLPGMGAEYANTLRALDDDPRVRGILVTGAGRGFCSGADISVLGEDAGTLQQFLSGPQDLPTEAFALRTPVATAINGPCAGIGFVMAVCADARFAHPEATLTTSFARLGLVAEYGIAWVLPRLIGLPAATDLLLSGRSITGREAEELGLVVCADDPVAAAHGWLAEIATACSPTSMAEMKRQLLAAWSVDLDTSARDSLDRMAASFTRPDLREALTARVERRPPDFPDYVKTPQ